jgi:hypothetical protein
MNRSSHSRRRISSTTAPTVHIVFDDGGNGRSSIQSKAISKVRAASATSSSRDRGIAVTFLLILQLCCLAHVAVIVLAVQGEASPTPSDSSYVVCPDNIRTVDDYGDINYDTRKDILRFLDCAAEDGETVVEDEFPFHIQGWRWHFMSLIRDSRRLGRLSMHLANLTEKGDVEQSGFDALDRAADYVVNFNMAGLFTIQSGIFVNFLRRHLCDEATLGRFCAGNSTAETDAFEALIRIIDNQRARSENVGRELVRGFDPTIMHNTTEETVQMDSHVHFIILLVQYKSANAASKVSQSSQNKQRLLGDVARSSKRLVDQLTSMRNLQETYIVPAISRVIPSNVQKSFNNKVLRQLGLLDSRLHLVGMHDAVWESGIEAEKTKFEKEIPYVARIMIERWRESLYIPKAGVLDYGLT